jgi:hypothetical protein
VSVRLKVHPYDRDGLLWDIDSRQLAVLVERLVVECQVPLRIKDVESEPEVLPPFELATANPAAVFDRLYPAARDGNDALERLRLEQREEFVRGATEVPGGAGAPPARSARR